MKAGLRYNEKYTFVIGLSVMGHRYKQSPFDALGPAIWPLAAIASGGLLAFAVLQLSAGLAGDAFLSEQGHAPVLYLSFAVALFALLALIGWRRSQRSQKHATPETCRLDPVLSELPDLESCAAEPWQTFGSKCEPVMWPDSLPTTTMDWSLHLMESMERASFAALCRKFYEIKGFRSDCRAFGPNGGIDIRLYQDAASAATAIVHGQIVGAGEVGVQAIETLLGAMRHEQASKAFFMTNGKYSAEAKGLAAFHRVVLVDGGMFLMMLQRLPVITRLQLLEVASAGTYRIPGYSSDEQNRGDFGYQQAA